MLSKTSSLGFFVPSLSGEKAFVPTAPEEIIGLETLIMSIIVN